MCLVRPVALKKGLGQLSTCASPVLGQEPARSPHLSQRSHGRLTATPGACPAHTLLQNALSSPLGSLSPLPRPGTPLSAAKLQDSPSSSKMTLAQGFPEKGRRLPNEWFTPSLPFCHISLHLPAYLCKPFSDVSMEHECALRSQAFIAAFSGLCVQ